MVTGAMGDVDRGGDIIRDMFSAFVEEDRPRAK
jgi:hypothetical protein